MFYSAISELDFFDNVRNENKNLVNDLITENEGDKNKIVITKKGEIQEIKDILLPEPKLKVNDININPKNPIKKKNCSC